MTLRVLLIRLELRGIDPCGPEGQYFCKARSETKTPKEWLSALRASSPHLLDIAAVYVYDKRIIALADSNGWSHYSFLVGTDSKPKEV